MFIVILSKWVLSLLQHISSTSKHLLFVYLVMISFVCLFPIECFSDQKLITRILAWIFCEVHINQFQTIHCIRNTHLLGLFPFVNLQYYGPSIIQSILWGFVVIATSPKPLNDFLKNICRYLNHNVLICILQRNFYFFYFSENIWLF